MIEQLAGINGYSIRKLKYMLKNQGKKMHVHREDPAWMI